MQEYPSSRVAYCGRRDCNYCSFMGFSERSTELPIIGYVKERKEPGREMVASQAEEGHLHLVWSLKNKFPESSRRLPTLPMMKTNE